MSVRSLPQALLSTLLLGSLLVGTAMAATPDLPKEFVPKKPGIKVTLLEFSAPWCSSCRKLKPEVESLQKQNGLALNVVDLNVDKPETEKYITLYKLDSAPTYYLYDAKGKLIDKVEREITPQELRTLVTKALSSRKK